MNPRVSIVILNYNDCNNVINCLNSLINQNFDNFEIILLDNGSKKTIYQKLKKKVQKIEKDLKIKLIRSERNLYFGPGCNKCIKETEGNYLCLLNYDTILESNYLKKMVEFMDNHPEAGMITPKIKIYDDKNILWNTGAYVDFRSGIVIGNRGYLEYDPNNAKYNKVQEVGFAPGTAMFLRREIIEEVGLIDEIFLMYHEDPDWNLRAQKNGFKSYYVPTTTVYHDIPRVYSEDQSNFKQYFLTRNAQILVWKHAKFMDIIIFYYIFSIMNIFIILYYLFSKKIDDLIIKLKSIWQGFRIGVRRRTNRSCKSYLLKDYKFSRRIQKF